LALVLHPIPISARPALPRTLASVRALLIVAGLGLTAPAFAGNPAELPDARLPLAVVELFTSQGCSSSPPADEFLGELAREADIVAVSLPVTYWDYLGWTDTRASQANTSRQFSYAARRGDRAVFTPQMIVNGRTPVVGSDAEEVRAVIAEQAGVGLGPTVPVDIRLAGRIFEVTVGRAPPTLEAMPATVASDSAPPQLVTATVWIGAVEPSVTVPIARGENAGRRLTYRNVVRFLLPIGVWRGEPMSISLPADQIDRRGSNSAVVILQAEVDGRPGAILGAAMLRPPEG
jgi:hypothetical protein